MHGDNNKEKTDLTFTLQLHTYLYYEGADRETLTN